MPLRCWETKENSMKQSLQIKLGQSLTMTPQLQQAIRLLQLSSLELEAEIQEALDSNPLLEVDEESARSNEASPDERSTAEASSESSAEAPAQEERELQNSDNIPEELPVDSGWDDVFEAPAGPMLGGADDDQREFEHGSSGQSLQEYLTWQIEMGNLSLRDRDIAGTIIDSIDDDGYLTTALDELLVGFDEEDDIELDEIEAVLRVLQNCDPAGVAARDLRESILLQLQQYDAETPWLKEGLQLIGEFMDLLAARDFKQIMRRMKLSEEALMATIALVQSVNPRPGNSIAEAPSEYVVPEVLVKKVKGQWKVELNPECAPKIKVNPYYSGMIRRADSSADNTYLKNNLQEARWFIKSLKSRSETLLKVSKCIVEYQRAFFEYGEEAMRALVLADVAEEVEMHESTISRVTTKKYMHTPRGIFELKYFFSSHVGTVGGGECSSTAIRALLKKLITAEEPKKPLSDNKLAGLLGEQGINVARRTVAKYREAMSIPPSNERKRLG